METPRYGAGEAIAEVAVATAAVLVAGFGLWPPGAVYWTRVADVVGEGPTLLVVFALAVGLGAWFARTSSFAVRHVIAGGLLAYVLGMGAIEVLLAPDSPVHLIGYGVLLAALVAGGLAWRTIERVARRPADG